MGSKRPAKRFGNSFRRFVDIVAGAVNEYVWSVESDNRTREIFAGDGSFEDRVDEAVSYWLARLKFSRRERTRL